MTVTMAVFLATVVSVAALLVLAARRAGAAAGSGRLVVAAILVFWVIVPAVLAGLGALDRYDPPPAPALLVLGSLSVATTVLAFSPFGAKLAAGIPLAALVGYQAFRIPVEWVLHRLYLEGTVPVQMTFAGRNFDILTGISAIVVALSLRAGRRSDGLVLAWNLMGLGLLVNIVTIAILSTPSPFRRFLEGPPNLVPSELPWVLLPSFLVQAALFGHLVVFRAVRRGAEAATRPAG